MAVGWVMREDTDRICDDHHLPVKQCHPYLSFTGKQAIEWALILESSNATM